jgi:hypothetical protein
MAEAAGRRTSWEGVSGVLECNEAAPEPMERVGRERRRKNLSSRSSSRSDFDFLFAAFPSFVRFRSTLNTHYIKHRCVSASPLPLTARCSPSSSAIFGVCQKMKEGSGPLEGRAE